MIYDKDKLKEELTIDKIFSIVQMLGGEPIYSSFGFISKTICHNPSNQGSYKLYFYKNTQLFKCYTGCNDIFDIFELIIKTKKIQEGLDLDLPKAMNFVVNILNLNGDIYKASSSFEDLEVLDNYERILNLNYENQNILLEEYDKKILQSLQYPIIPDWEKEGISRETMKKNLIGYYLGDDQITIPHFDKDNRFIGLRGRFVVSDDANRFGKYKPLRINGMLYSHPLGLNLYNLNNSQNNIKKLKKVIVFESEKATLAYQSYAGFENDISVAVCGFSISAYQMKLLLDLNPEEIVIAFDRQFKEPNKSDIEFQKLEKNFIGLAKKYSHLTKISFIFDKNKITDYKDSPIDKGWDIFLQLFKERILL